MKKVVKGLAIAAASAVLCAGVGVMAGCAGSDGTYEGSYSYENYGQTYGMSVKVTVKNNIITKVEDTTAQLHADWHAVSPGWEDYYTASGADLTPSAVYTITTKKNTDIDISNFRPNGADKETGIFTLFTFKVAVGEDGTIKSFEIVTNGSTADRYTNMMPESFRDGTFFVGKTEEDILKAFGGSLDYADSNIKNGLTSNELSTGATQSDYICLQVAAFASANAKAAFEKKGVADLKEYADVIDVENSSVEIVKNDIPSAPDWYKWTNDNAKYWTNTKAYLLQQYEGLAVADVLDIKVFVDDYGQPYATKDDHNIARNPQLEASGLLITGATQGSGRLLLAIQDALTK